MGFNYKKIVGAALIAVAMFLLPALVYPQYLLMEEYRGEIKEYEQKIDEKRELIAAIQTLKEESVLRRNDIERLSLVVPQLKRTDDVIEGISIISQQSGLQLRSITISPRQVLGVPYEILGIELNLSGSYGGLYGFLSLLEESLRIFDATELTVSEETIGGGLNFRILINAYFLE